MPGHALQGEQPRDAGLEQGLGIRRLVIQVERALARVDLLRVPDKREPDRVPVWRLIRPRGVNAGILVPP